MANICINSLIYQGHHSVNVYSSLLDLEEVTINRLTVNDEGQMFFESDDCPPLPQIKAIAKEHAGAYQLEWAEDMMGIVGRLVIHPDGTEQMVELTDQELDAIEEDEEGFYLFEGETYGLKGTIQTIMLDRKLKLKNA